MKWPNESPPKSNLGDTGDTLLDSRRCDTELVHCEVSGNIARIVENSMHILNEKGIHNSKTSFSVDSRDLVRLFSELNVQYSIRLMTVTSNFPPHVLKGD